MWAIAKDAWTFTQPPVTVSLVSVDITQLTKGGRTCPCQSSVSLSGFFSSIPRSIRFDGSVASCVPARTRLSKSRPRKGSLRLSSLPDVRDHEQTVYGVRELTAPPRERLYFPCRSASASPPCDPSNGEAQHLHAHETIFAFPFARETHGVRLRCLLPKTGARTRHSQEG